MPKFMAISVVALLAACTSDVVTSRYETLADARADELFGRGWLPDVLPASAFDIRTTNNLDLNVSDGEFSFSPGDASKLFQHLRNGGPSAVPYPEYSDNISAQSRRGYSVWSLQAEQTTWVFFCRASKGYCEYTMWLDRNAPNNSFKPNPHQVP